MDTRQRVIDAAIAATGAYGLSEVRIRHIALSCGVAEGTIYRHFPSKDALLAACFQEIDGELADFMERFSTGLGSLEDCESTLQLLWGQLCRRLLAGQDRTRFYFQFRDAPCFRPEMQARSKAAASVLARALEGCWHLPEGSGGQICFYLLSHAQWFVRQVFSGELGEDAETARQVFALLYRGVDACFPAGTAGPAEKEENR